MSLERHVYVGPFLELDARAEIKSQDLRDPWEIVGDVLSFVSLSGRAFAIPNQRTRYFCQHLSADRGCVLANSDEEDAIKWTAEEYANEIDALEKCYHVSIEYGILQTFN